MLIIIASWVYIVTIAYCLGAAFHAGLQKIFRTRAPRTAGPLTTDPPLHFSLNAITGLMVLTFICMSTCLFMPLGLASNLLILLITLGASWLARDCLRASLAADWSRLKQGNWVVSLIFLAFIFIISRLSYEPSSHFDDGLYYSTTIRWLQEYGTVKGLASINARIGFNSSWHILQANFGFRFLDVGLFNDLNGLIYLLMLLYSIGGINDLLKGDSQWRTALRAFIMLPVIAFHFGATSDLLLFNINFISSPTSDIPACLLTWLIFLLFLTRTNQRKDGGTMPLTDILVVLYSAWACTIKFSVVPIFLLSACLVYRLAVARQFRQITGLVLGCMLIATPWVVRNILISGYLLFPFSAIDIFHVQWKLPISVVRRQENAIKASALGSSPDKPFETPITVWFPKWVTGLDFMRQVILGAVFLATLFYFTTGIYLFFKKGVAVFSMYLREIMVVVTGLAGILFWVTKAPDFRFGYGFLVIYCMLFLVLACRYGLERHSRYLVYPALLYMCTIAFLHYYSSTWKRIRPYIAPPLSYRMPQDMTKVSTPDGKIFYIVTKGDSWNGPLPIANDYEYYATKPVYMGSRIEDGFMPKKQP
jgi:hypothetical protein